MFRLSIVVCVLVELLRVRTALLTDAPESLAERLDKLYEKLERITVMPAQPPDRSVRHYAKLDRLNALNPESFAWSEEAEDSLTDDDEELLSKMQQWAAISPDQLGDFAKELQMMKDPDAGERVKEDDADEAWGEDFQELKGEIEDYAMDGGEDGWDEDEEQPEASTAMPKIRGYSTRPADIAAGYRPTVATISALDPVAATAERPKILDDSTLTAAERYSVRRAALSNMGMAVRTGKCLTPQPRWLAVRQMAPAADSVYLPPCVQLHRCAPDSGCCDNEDQVCTPVEGKHVPIPLYVRDVRKSDGNLSVVRMLFYNHTACACAWRESQSPPPPAPPAPRTEPPAPASTPAPAPQLRRCACPSLFLARHEEGGACACGCAWAEAARRRGCLSLARGREHFGLRDRLCVARGACAAPACDHGAYDRAAGRCPLAPRRARPRLRLRSHARRHGNY